MNSKSALILAVSATLSTSALAQFTAVDFSGDYSASTPGFPTISFNNAVSSETGDYDFDGNADDRRTYHGINTVLDTVVGNPFSSGAPNRTDTVRAGFQVVNVDSATDPSFSLRRKVANTGGDWVQVTQGAGTTAMRLASAVNVAKTDFLNGMDAVANLSFANQAGSATAQVTTLSPGSGNSISRLLVQNGSNWYISDTALTSAGTLTVNGYTEDWYSYDPSTNLLYDNSNLGSSVVGSTFNDIQAFGAIAQTTANFDGTTANTGWYYTRNIGLTVVPEPSAFALALGALALGGAALRRRRSRD